MLRILGLIILLGLFAVIVWSAVTNQRIPLVERLSVQANPPYDQIAIEGVPAAYQDVDGGPGTFVLLHDDHVPGGATLSQLADALADATGARVVVPDLFGFGWSGRSVNPGRHYSVAGQADWLVALFDEIGVGSAHFIGFGLGGRVTLELAAIAPGLVTEATLINASADDERPFSEAIERLPFNVGLAVSHTLEGGSESAVERFFLGCETGGWCDDANLRSAVRLTTTMMGTSQAIHARRLSEPASLASGRLGAIDIPVIVLYSEMSDDDVRAEAAEALAEALPSAELVPLAGTDLLPEVERVDEIVAAVG